MTLFSSPNPLLEIMSILKTIFKQSPKQCGCQSINPLEDTYFMTIINGFCFNPGDLYPFLSLSLQWYKPIPLIYYLFEFFILSFSSKFLKHLC